MFTKAVLPDRGGQIIHGEGQLIGIRKKFFFSFKSPPNAFGLSRGLNESRTESAENVGVSK